MDGLPRVGRRLLNKVPEATVYFWIIKILCTTVGETAADYLNTTLKFGLTGTSVVMGVLLIIALAYQLWTRRYVPWIYWLVVVLVSIVGTLITDNLTDHLGVSLPTAALVFGIALALTFALWYRAERTLSIVSIVTTRREVFYWLAILFTFALGTATGDLSAEKLGLGYRTSALIFAGLIALVTAAHYALAAHLGPGHVRRSSHAVLAFWTAYVLTRPLGASIGDYLSQERKVGGLGLGTTVTSAIFLGAILVTVLYLAVTKKDVIREDVRV